MFIRYGGQNLEYKAGVLLIGYCHCRTTARSPKASNSEATNFETSSFQDVTLAARFFQQAST